MTEPAAFRPGTPARPPVIAVFNSNSDTVELIRVWFESAGMVVVSGHLDDVKRGALDLRAFLAQHAPAAVVIDLAPPYDRTWLFARHLQATVLGDVPLVLTTTNEQRVREVVGETAIIEIVGKPYDMDLLLRHVRQAAGLPPAGRAAGFGAPSGENIPS